MLNRQYDSALEDFQLAFQAFFSEKDPQSRVPGTLSPSHALSDYVPPHVIKDAGFCYYKLNQFEASSRLYDQTLTAYKKRNVSISPKVYGMAGLCQLLSGQSENAYPFFEKAAKQALLVPGWIWARAAHRFLEMERFAEVSGFSARAQSSYEFQKKKIPLDYWEPAITAAVKVGRSNAFVIGLVEKALFAFRCHNIKPPQSLFISGMHVYLKMGDLEKALELSHLSVQHL